MPGPDPLLLEADAADTDSTVGLAELLAAQLHAARETALKLSRSSGSSLLCLNAESLAEDLRVMGIDEVDSGVLFLAKQEANEAHGRVERAYPQDYRRIA